MKIGDTIAVSMAGFDVAMATIESIEDDKATILIPATRVVMGVSHSLTDINETPEVDRVFAGAASTDAAPSEAVADVNTSDDVGNGIRNMNLDSSAID